MLLLDRNALWDVLDGWGKAEWIQSLQTLCQQRFSLDSHGTLAQWVEAWHAMPAAETGSIQAADEVVRVVGGAAKAMVEATDDARQLTDLLMKLHPWRKGPFEFFGTFIDTEWRSDWKWNRLAQAVDLRGRRILDVGCGNGYYGWRMLQAGAECVVGCDPFLLYNLQFELVRKYASVPERHFIVPLGDSELPDNLSAFDTCFSMGVLYHRTGPIDHLQKMHGTLKPGGQLIMETLVIDGSEANVLVPSGRYAKMRNVWFIPTVPMLLRWLARTGFTAMEVIDVSVTTTDEQRATAWMTFESLADFLDPADRTKTIEGFPAPRRALVSCYRR